MLTGSQIKWQILALLAGLLIMAPQATGQLFGPSWPKITEAEKNLDGPKIDPEANAEILLRQVEIDDSRSKYCIYNFFRRVKIFTQAGVDQMKEIELE